MSKKLLSHPLVLVALVLVALSLTMGWFGVREFRRSLWESMLFGPFYGTAYAGELTSKPASTLNLSRNVRLELHEVADVSAPVLALSRDGRIQWKQALIPMQPVTNGKTIVHTVKGAQLREKRFSLSGTKVFFTCYWSGGGHEGGLIYLNTDGSLDRFAISW